MSNLDDEILKLRDKTNQNRRDFLRIDLQTCFLALDRAEFELSLGNRDEAAKELAAAYRGSAVIERFLREAPEELEEIRIKLAELKGSLAAFKAELQRVPG